MRFASVTGMDLSNRLNWVCSLVFICTSIQAYASDSENTQIQAPSFCRGTQIEAAPDRPLIFANGEGLPEGSGMAAEGGRLFEQRCQRCHGEQGIGATSVELVGEHKSLKQAFPVKAVGSYWPAAPTLFGFIQQAMPPQNNEMDEPRLSNDESYALVAYLLVLNNLWSEGSLLDASALAMIEMPNRNGFDESALAEQANSHQLASLCAQ